MLSAKIYGKNGFKNWLVLTAQVFRVRVLRTRWDPEAAVTVPEKGRRGSTAGAGETGTREESPHTGAQANTQWR